MRGKKGKKSLLEEDLANRLTIVRKVGDLDFRPSHLSGFVPRALAFGEREGERVRNQFVKFSS